MENGKTIFDKTIDLNHGHDRVRIEAASGYGEVVEITLCGRDPTTVIVRLHEMDDVRALGKALIAAADEMEAALGQSEEKK